LLNCVLNLDNCTQKKSLNYYFSHSFFFLGIFSLISNTSSSKDTVVETEQLLPEQLEKVPVNLVVHYPKKATTKVRSKLDSLLKRIHKRHDFHGAVLVAKNKK
jgi:hypothetical protein